MLIVREVGPEAMRTVDTWRDGRGPYWGGPCPAARGCCRYNHTLTKRAENQTLWSALPTPCTMLPHPALVDNVLRDGDHGTVPDRRLADELVHISLAAPAAVRDRDQFTARVVEHALAEGITQFLDLGSGLACTSAAYATLAAAPSRTGAAASIVFVDNDIRVAERNRAWLRQHAQPGLRAAAIRGNCFAVPGMLSRLRQAKLVDSTRPVCVLMIDILHYFERRAPGVVTRSLATKLPSGSIAAVTHLSDEPLLPSLGRATRVALREDTARWCRAYQRCVPPHPRAFGPARFATVVSPLRLLGTGITSTSCWPDPDTTRHPSAPFSLAAVGRVSTVTTPQPRSARTP